jgi:hypothetical protein
MHFLGAIVSLRFSIVRRHEVTQERPFWQSQGWTARPLAATESRRWGIRVKVSSEEIEGGKTADAIGF